MEKDLFFAILFVVAIVLGVALHERTRRNGKP